MPESKPYRMPGVTYNGETRRWCVSICLKSISYYLGSYVDKDTACAIRTEANEAKMRSKATPLDITQFHRDIHAIKLKYAEKPLSDLKSELPINPNKEDAMNPRP